MLKKFLEGIAVTVLGAGFICAYAYTPDTQVIEYRKEVAKGDTVWSICSQIATNEDNLQELVYRTEQENHLHDGQIHEGMELVIHVHKKPSFCEEIKAIVQ